MGSHAGKGRVLIAFAVLSVGVGAGVAHAAPGNIHELGTFGEQLSGSDGFAINGVAQVAAGYSEMPNDAGEHAFRCTGIPGSDGVMHDLGTAGEVK